ncbi:tRNA (guanine(46)-N(7))-methyltransferase TrmB [Oceanospirillum maris]|jgi:tRNA G46 methylase TrmB|uniref:tRNA (guanine(46)-N(7))-methyltransferase TrmB n=1 Tax=Oceanospirillum maris TaxID=64977 RepID=UPI0003FDD85B|nr:hypothetical protein [Oceanospirillum maris]
MKHRPHGNKSFGNSREIHTTQDGPHEGLAERVFKHCRQPFKKPYQQHNIDAFKKANNWLRGQNKPLILDSCCGVGESTRQLAGMFPDHAVIGVDQSEDRLSRKLGELPNNALLIRANLLDFWRLAVEAGWQPERHYLLYPNPYPKKSQFKLRWQGGPMLPYIAALGGRFECRSNWKIYVQEMAQAVSLLRLPTCDTLADDLNHISQDFLDKLSEQVVAIEPEPVLTPFERKYLGSGQQVYQWVFSEQNAQQASRDDEADQIE